MPAGRQEIRMVLQRYILKELAIAFLMVLAVLLSVLVITLTLVQLHRFTADIAFALELIPYLLPGTMVYTIPFALLVASIFVFGRLSASNEIMAIKTGGIHLTKIMWPACLLGLGLAVVVIFFTAYLVPYCYTRGREVTVNTIKNRILSPNLASHLIKLPEHLVHFVDFHNGIFKKIIVARLDKDKGEFKQELRAEEGRFSLDEENAVLILDLKNIIETNWEYVKPEADKPRVKEPRMMKSGALTQRTDLSQFFLLSPRKNLASMSQRELDRLIYLDKTDRFRASEILTEKHQRWATGLTPFIFLWLGMPLGIIIRKGSKILGIGISCLVIFLGYYPLVMLGNMLGARNQCPPQLIVWLAPLCGLVVGAGLFYQILKR